MRRLLLALILLALSAGCNGGASATSSGPVVREWKPDDYPKGEVNLLAMGDWGSGGSRQPLVARTLAAYIADSGIQFHGLLSPGDNFYVDLRSTEDRNWARYFEQMYDPKRFNFPFYAILGNHDYEQAKERVEIEYTKRYPESRWRLPARWYRIDMPQQDPLVTILMLDSNRDKLSRSAWRRQMQWLGNELARPRRSRWLIVCAHHPLYTNGLHGDNRTLQREWGPLLERYNVDFYLAGHDHDLQHLQVSGQRASHVISGGGGQRPRLMRRGDRGPFSRSLNGFVHFRLTEDQAVVRYVEAPSGNVAHLFQRLPDGTVQVLGTTGREPPTTRPTPTPRDFEEIDQPRPVTAPAVR